MSDTVKFSGGVAPAIRLDGRLDVRASAETRPQDAAKAVGETIDARAIPQTASASSLKIEGSRLTVSLDPGTDTFVYKSISHGTGDVVWQWPAESVLRVMEYFRNIEGTQARLEKARAVDETV
jgi:uncharacterized FlaG/YvyC family protein